jgi:amino acid transporter
LRAEKGQAVGLPVEVVLVWMIFVVVTAEILVTYSRLPARELYHVSGSGIEGGLSRALLFTNFPVALVALAVLALVYERLPARGYRVAALVSCALCVVILWPGVVKESDLDARPVNAFAAVGVLLAILLTDVVARAGGLTKRPWRRPDWFRVAIAAVLLFAALPWLAADLGFYLNGVPLLGRLFQTGEFLHERPGLPTFAPAVHHGHHHGMDGVLLVLVALLLSRRVGDVRGYGLRQGLAAYLALMFCYGIANFANDIWIEQVVKRGWTSWEIPNVVEPRVTVAWSLIVIAAVILWAVWTRLVDWDPDEESPLRTQSDRLPARR